MQGSVWVDGVWRGVAKENYYLTLLSSLLLGIIDDNILPLTFTTLWAFSTKYFKMLSAENFTQSPKH